MVALQLGLGLAGLLSCLLALLATGWFCRSLSRAASRARQQEVESEVLELRDRRSKSPTPPDLAPAIIGPGPGAVLSSMRPDFAAFYGNPHLSSNQADDSEDEEAADHFSALYGNPLLSSTLREVPSPLPLQRSVYFSKSPAQQHHYAPRPALSMASGGDSVYSEPLLGYGDLSYSALALDCEDEDDISTLPD